MMKQSLYEEVGGHSTLVKIHKIFYDKVYADPWLKKFFEGHDQSAIEARQTSFMGEKMGGPEYIGKPLKQAHENMYITNELAELRHELLAESLSEAGINEKLANRWLRIDHAFTQQTTKKSLESFYKEYKFPYKRRIIIPKPETEAEAG